jgi:lipid A 4'-phosphatase
MAIWACIVGVPAIATFTLVPELDLGFASIRAGERLLRLAQQPGSVMRTMFRAIFILCCAVAAAGLALAVFRRSTPLRLRTGQWLFLVLCLSVGPGLVVNVLLKDQWGRARPVQIV